MKLPTVKIKDPNSEGSLIVINESDFDAKVHKRFEEPKKKAPKKQESKGDENGKEETPFPEGYRYEADGAYGHLYGPEDVLIEGPSNGKFHGRDAALEFAVAHAAKGAGTE